MPIRVDTELSAAALWADSGNSGALSFYRYDSLPFYIGIFVYMEKIAAQVAGVGEKKESV